MLLIPCPYCGPRSDHEFVWGGEADIRRPDANASDSEWADYLFMRRNIRGACAERWLHALGCRQWFILERDTYSHEIGSSRSVGNAP